MKNIRNIVICVVLILLAACQVEGGVSSPSQPGELPQGTETPTEAPIPTRMPPQPGFRIGLLEEPRDLLPFHEDAADERITAPVSELLFPSPLLAVNYMYTTTGVLEQLPSFQNGGVKLQDVDVYVDEAGEILSLVSDVMTPTQELSATNTLTATEQMSETQEMLVFLSETGEISQAQQIVITCNWNSELRWSDGVQVTADDSVFSYDLAKTLLLGNDAFNRYNFVERYEKVDDHTTQVLFKPEFLTTKNMSGTFTDPSYYLHCWTPLPSHILEHDTAAMLFDFAWKPVGYGPYMIDRREQNGIRMKRNPYYQGTMPQEDELLFLFLPGFEMLRNSILNGSLDIAVADTIDTEQFEFLERDEDLGLYEVAYISSPIWEHMDFNLDVKLLQDFNVRRGIAYATNRQAMVDQIFQGHVPVLDSWIVPDNWAAAPAEEITQYPYNVEEANRLLDSVPSLDSNGDGVRDPVSIRLITTDNNPVRDKIARMFQADMAKVGIVVDIQAVPSQQFYDTEGPLFRRQFHIAEFAWIATPDPGGLSLWSCPAVPNERNNWTGNNFAGWCFRDADQAIREATTAQSLEERKQAYLTQQKLFTQELPSLPLFQRLSLTLKAPYMRQVQPDTTAPVTWNISEWQKNYE